MNAAKKEDTFCVIIIIFVSLVCAQLTAQEYTKQEMKKLVVIPSLSQFGG